MWRTLTEKPESEIGVEQFKDIVDKDLTNKGEFTVGQNLTRQEITKLAIRHMVL